MLVLLVWSLLLPLNYPRAFDINSDLIVRLYEEKFKPAMDLSGTLTYDDWMRNLPTERERNEMFQLIDFIYPMQKFSQFDNSVFTQRFPHLATSVQVEIYNDSLCVIHEPLSKSSVDSKFPRHFGFVVVRSEQDTTHRLHHSAAHFETDGHVCLQATVMFSATNSKSLVVAGASRSAVRGEHNNSCQSKAEVADAAHNTNLIFHAANTALLKAAKKYGQKRMLADHFLQWHGMAETSCPNSSVFISIGAPRRLKLHANATLYVDKLRAAVNQITGEQFVQTSQTDTSCSLLATTNVFGRVVNGVSPSKECQTNALGKNIHGNFIHIEQKERSRNNLTLWQAVFKLLDDAANSATSRWYLTPTMYCFLAMLAWLIIP